MHALSIYSKIREDFMIRMKHLILLAGACALATTQMPRSVIVSVAALQAVPGTRQLARGHKS